MKVNSVKEVCDFFMPNEERPINRTFEFLGEEFNICTYLYMRGPFGLRGDETFDGYFVSCYSEWLDFQIDVYPERGEVRKRIGLKKERGRRKVAPPDNYERVMQEIDAAFSLAIYSKSSKKEVDRHG